MKQQDIRLKIRKSLKKGIKEGLMGGYGFTNDMDNRAVINRIRKEASNNTIPELPEAPVGGDNFDSEIPTPDLGVDQNPSSNPMDNQKPEKPKKEKPAEPKAKSKDFSELIDELTLYIANAAAMVGDEQAENQLKILDKVYEVGKEKLGGGSEEIEGIAEKKKLKEKKSKRK